MSNYFEQTYRGVLITMHENGSYVAYCGVPLSSDTITGIKSMIRARVKEQENAEDQTEE